MYLMVMKTNDDITTNHYKNKRSARENFISEHLHGDGMIVDGFIIDKGHKNGLEVHSITDKGIIIIHNLNSGKLITKLLARPWQIIRYYKITGRQPPAEYEEILRLAELHKQLGYNEI